MEPLFAEAPKLRHVQREEGVRGKVQPDSRIPGNWDSFMRIDDNKTELFSFLANQAMLVRCEADKRVVSALFRIDRNYTTSLMRKLTMDSEINDEGFWIAFGVCKNFRYI